MVMKKIASITALLLALVCASASASQLNLAWTNCYGDGGTTNQDFACDTNTGSHTFIASFTPNMTSNSVNGNEILIDLQSAGSTLPTWWAFKLFGTCRQTSLTVSSNVPATAVNCIDQFAGQKTSGIDGYRIGFGGSPNKVRLTILEAVPVADLAHVDPSGEYFAIAVRIDNAKTVGSPSCAGCSTPVCIVLNLIKLTAGGGANDEYITSSPGTNYVTWQGGAIGSSGCPAATPARNTTWGAVKSLYR
jgi:hypothetical protein